MSDFTRDLTFEHQIEVLSAADGVRRRNWSDADKLRIVEESFAGHRQVSATARRHGVSRSLLTVWRRQFRNGGFAGGGSPTFVPVTSPMRAGGGGVSGKSTSGPGSQGRDYIR
ncbi:transposase [Microbulbifer sp. S227A]|uniref:transposase n=1 Tax=Microbulbifer sp. S227A TaxID=3415131 RepID=UPI003C7BA740